MLKELNHVVGDVLSNSLESSETVAPESPPVVAEDPVVAPENRHAVAGRQGAKRRQELIERGKLYEQEHGLKRGRQRIRQLIEEGKLYEQEHQLRPRRPRKQGPRLSEKQRLQKLLEAILRVSRSSYRPALERLIQSLEADAA